MYSAARPSQTQLRPALPRPKPSPAAETKMTYTRIGMPYEQHLNVTKPIYLYETTFTYTKPRRFYIYESNI